jgi:hypothetical protein
MMLSHVRGELLIIWIPAFAGMTQFCVNELSELVCARIYNWTHISDAL